MGYEISFAHTGFKWTNLASHNAGVTVIIVAITNRPLTSKRIYSVSPEGETVFKQVSNINSYLVPGLNVIAEPVSRAPRDRAQMVWGNKPSDGGNLILSAEEARTIVSMDSRAEKFVFDFVGSQEFVKGIVRRCIWIEDSEVDEAIGVVPIARRIEKVREMRLASKATSTQEYAEKAHRFRQIQGRGERYSVVVPKVTSESRPYLPVGILSKHSIVSDNAFAMYDAPLWSVAVIASKIHLVWVQTVCGQLETRLRYSNTMGWNSFPLPKLTEKNKEDLIRCAEDILLARETHFPATIADLYDPDKMPADLRAAHDRNDETLERIYIGRRFRNDTERLEKLFQLYTQLQKKGKNYET
jgi:hypothetical protein